MAVTGPTPEANALLRDQDLAVVRERIGECIEATVARAAADGVVVPMDGGLTATLSATLAVEALGADRVVSLSMPCHKTADAAAIDAGTFAEALGVEHHRVQLKPLVETFREVVGTATDSDADPALYDNVAARTRMTAAYFVANARNMLVLGTPTRTELLLGHVTKHGDSGADLLPLGNLYRTEVRNLGREVGIPRRVIEREGSPGRHPGVAEAVGVDAATVDEVLEAVVDDDLTPRTAARTLSVPVEDVRTIVERWVDSEHKRRCPATPDADGSSTVGY